MVSCLTGRDGAGGDNGVAHTSSSLVAAKAKGHHTMKWCGKATSLSRWSCLYPGWGPYYHLAAGFCIAVWTQAEPRRQASLVQVCLVFSRFLRMSAPDSYRINSGQLRSPWGMQMPLHTLAQIFQPAGKVLLWTVTHNFTGPCSFYSPEPS